MNNEDYCPFYFGVCDKGYCIGSICALWVDDGQNSACGLAYEALLMAKNHKRRTNIRRLTPWGTIKVFGRYGDCDA